MIREFPNGFRLIIESSVQLEILDAGIWKLLRTYSLSQLEEAENLAQSLSDDRPKASVVCHGINLNGYVENFVVK